VIKMNNIQAVLAKSFARIFIETVLIWPTAVICDTERFEERRNRIFYEEGKLLIIPEGDPILHRIPPVMKRILSDGGLVEHVKNIKT